MTRKDDDKMDASRERQDENTRKIEARFTKQALAKMNQKGELQPDKMNDSHQDDGGEHRL